MREPLSASAVSDLLELWNCAFRAILSLARLTFPQGLDLVEGCEKEVWLLIF